MITLPELAAEALGSFLASDMKDRFGASHARLAELIPFAARLTLECIGNSDALYHNVEHTMLVTLAGHDIFKGQASTATYFVPSVSYAIRGHRSSVISDAAERATPAPPSTEEYYGLSGSGRRPINAPSQFSQSSITFWPTS